MNFKVKYFISQLVYIPKLMNTIQNSIYLIIRKYASYQNKLEFNKNISNGFIISC